MKITVRLRSGKKLKFEDRPDFQTTQRYSIKARGCFAIIEGDFRHHFFPADTVREIVVDDRK